MGHQHLVSSPARLLLLAMPLYRCSALLLAAGAVASVAASADSVVFINNMSYPICPESGTVTVKCAAKTTFASAELYELHEVDSIVCSSYILLPAENVCRRVSVPCCTSSPCCTASLASPSSLTSSWVPLRKLHLL